MNGNILIQHHNWLKWCLVLRGLCQLRNWFFKLEVSNPQGYPQIIHFILVYSIINHPAIGVPPFMETSLVLWPESSGSDRWGEAYQARGFLRVSLKASNPKVRTISCRTISWTISWRTISWLVVELLVDHFPMNQSIRSPAGASPGLDTGPGSGAPVTFPAGYFWRFPESERGTPIDSIHKKAWDFPL